MNVSIGGTLTHFAAPPVLMVSRPWGWDTPFMLTHFGWRAAAAIAVSTAVYFVVFRAELRALAARPAVVDVERPDDEAEGPLLPVPAWVTLVHVLFLVWTVVNVHHPALFIGGFLFFLGFARATAIYQSSLELRTPLLVGFFLAGLVIHGGLQGWWIAPVLASLSDDGLFAARHGSHGLQRQRAHHLPGDAGSESERRPEDRGRGGRRHRRRPDRDRQRTEPGGPGAAGPLLRRRRVPRLRRGSAHLVAAAAFRLRAPDTSLVTAAAFRLLVALLNRDAGTG